MRDVRCAARVQGRVSECKGEGGGRWGGYPEDLDFTYEADSGSVVPIAEPAVGHLDGNKPPVGVGQCPLV